MSSPRTELANAIRFLSMDAVQQARFLDAGIGDDQHLADIFAGKMLADAVDRMQEFPERVMLPGVMISLTVLSVNYLGDGLRDALDPRIRGR